MWLTLTSWLIRAFRKPGGAPRPQHASEAGRDLYQAGGDININTSASEEIAVENPNVTYITQHFDNNTQVHIRYAEADKVSSPPRTTQAALEAETGEAWPSPKTFIRFRPSGEILDASNITCVTTGGGLGEFDILFESALNPTTLVVHPIGSAPSHFRVEDATAISVQVIFENGEPDIIALRFDD